MIDQTDLAGGNVAYYDFHVDLQRPLGEQLDELKEDLIQAEYHDLDVVLDVGWYPSFSPDGRFVVQLVKAQDWRSPLLRLETNELACLRDFIGKAVAEVEQMRQISATT
ncbi:MAG TPA: hypothetical protein VF306_01150 [Pirellulales bacterium]